MKKTVILLFLSVILSFSLKAETELHYGFKTGLNIAQHYGTKTDEMDYEVKSFVRPGMSIAAFLDLQILNNLCLGYELLYTMKGSSQQIKIKRIELDGVMEDLEKPATMNVKYYIDYMEVPILLKVAVLLRNKFKMTAITGTAMALKLKGYHELDGMIYFPEGDGFSEIPIKESSRLKSVNMFDYSFVYGGSLEYKAALELFLEYRFTLGWDYLELPTYADFEPVELRNQTYSLLLGIRF